MLKHGSRFCGNLQLFALLVLTGSLSLSLSVIAGESRELQWNDLVPQTAAFEDPFEKLTWEQLSDLSDLVRARELKDIDDEEVAARTRERIKNLTVRLEDQGIDIDGLIAQREIVMEKRRQQAEAVDEKLNGQNVRIPGYLLPLEFDGTKVTEFLLVPYVGACIHTPPPPPNQIVHVSLSEGYESRGLFSPVWVEGTMLTESRSTELSLVDGSADIAVGYSLNADQIEDYE